jgi:DNA-binding IclR family transcriptional regulator
MRRRRIRIGYITEVVENKPYNSAQKTLLLLEALASVSGPIGVSDLGRAVGASRGTVHKQLSALVASGWVEQDADGRYGLSLMAARIGNAALTQAGLGRRIHGILVRLAEETGETISIATLHRGQALIVQRAEPDQVLHADIRVGTQLPLDVGASSLVLCAFALTLEQRDALRARGTAMPAEELVQRTFETGAAATVDEFVAGITAVAVPLHDSLRYRTVSLTLAGPNDRVDVPAAEEAMRRGRALINRLAADPSRP